VSNRIVMLAARDEDHLVSLVAKLQAHHISHTVFREPYYGDAVTAVAIRPLGDPDGMDDYVCLHVTRGLPLALSSRPPP